MKRTIEQLIDAVQLETVDDHGTARRALVRRIAALERQVKRLKKNRAQLTNLQNEKIARYAMADAVAAYKGFKRLPLPS